MARNSLYPGFIRFFYTANGHNHQMIMPVKPTASGATWALDKVLGSTYDPWTGAIDAWNILFKAELKTTDGIIGADLYTMASETADPLFRESYGSVVPGTSAVAIDPWSMTTVTFRTAAGGLLKLVLMEISGEVHDTRDTAPLAAGGTKALADFCIASTGFIFGRDGSRPLVAIAKTVKTSDALRRKFLFV